VHLEDPDAAVGIAVETVQAARPLIDIETRQPRRDGAATAPPRVIDLEAAADAEGDAESVLRPYRTGRLLTSEVEILQARRLHAAVFLDRHFIAPQDIADDGTIGPAKDPWPANSTYFAVYRGGVVVATARQISLARPADLAAVRRPGLDPREVARILALPSSEVVEISALAARRGLAQGSDVTAVYVRMWQESLTRGHQVWVMAVDVGVFARLRHLFCGDAIRPIGPHQHYLGSTVVPAVLWCHDVGPEQHRLARAAGDAQPFRKLLPRLFPPPDLPAR
jgi:hypothetical protein